MSEYKISVDSGTSLRLLTAGKYCDRDIVVTAARNEDEYIGVKYSNFGGKQYYLPQTADARSLDAILSETSSVESQHALTYAFTNTNANANGGFFANLKEVYLPSKATALSFTFDNCKSLTTIHGDLSNITSFNSTFRNCTNLDANAILARTTSLQQIGNNSFANCTQITELTLPATLQTIHSGAFNGCTNLKTINVPWSEGAITNAPWGATNATINYNYTGG